MRRSPTVLALYSIAARADVAAPALQVGTVGLARLRKPTAPPPPTPFEVTVETDFVGGSSRSTARLSERVLGESESTSGLAVLAPHGGRIEVGTDNQATRVYEILARERKPVRAWIAEGFNSVTGAHTCWHITATEISERSFPGLGRCSMPGRDADRSRTRWRSTARTTPRTSSWAAGARATARTRCSRRGSQHGSPTHSGP